MELISVEVNVETKLLASLQDGARGVQVKHPLLAEDIDVVNPEGPGGHQLFQPRQLDLQDVLSSLCNCLPSGEKKNRKALKGVCKADVARLRFILGHGVSSAVG